MEQVSTKTQKCHGDLLLSLFYKKRFNKFILFKIKEKWNKHRKAIVQEEF